MPLKDPEARKAYQQAYNKKYHPTRDRQYLIDKSARRKNEIREWLLEYKKQLSCSRCKENHPSCIAFHHTDPTKKDIGISEVVAYGWSIKRIQKEIDKCIPLCHNCHSKLHWEENHAS